MTLKDFLSAVGELDGFLEKGLTEEMIRRLTYVKTQENASLLLRLFCHVKAKTDPDPETAVLQMKMQDTGYSEAEIAEASMRLLLGEFTDAVDMQDVFAEVFGMTDMLRKTGKAEFSDIDIEQLYRMETW